MRKPVWFLQYPALALDEHEFVVAGDDGRRLTGHVRGDSVTYAVSCRGEGGGRRVEAAGLSLAAAVDTYNAFFAPYSAGPLEAAGGTPQGRVR